MLNIKIDFHKYADRGKTGLNNIGNTCFINSCIQILNHTFELVEVFQLEKVKRIMKQEAVDTSIVKEWIDLREIMWSNECETVTPNKFVYMIYHVADKKGLKELPIRFAQNDFTELFFFLMDCFHRSISRPIHMNIKGKEKNELDKVATKTYQYLKQTYSKEYSEIMELFYGMYLSNIMAMNGKKYSVTPELFLTTDLPIPVNMNRITLYDCLDYYTSPEYLSGENAWWNEATQCKEEVLKKITFWSLPPVFIITLKRFHETQHTKINHLVEFPIDELDMTRYVEGYNAHEYKYELFAICNHMGNVFGGHYTAFVKNMNGQWIHYNDNQLEIVLNKNHLITPMAYCLFYRKKNKYL
jgi:ubiquitin carboxyl-terminal hydrolase 8